MQQQNLFRAVLTGVAWTVSQCVIFLVVFEVGRRTLWTDVLGIPDADRAFFWQNYTFMFAGLSLVANFWIERKGLNRVLSRRMGVWLALMLILLFFSRVHFVPRPEAVVVTLISTAVALIFRELATQVNTTRPR